ncbi:phage integrase N-terminal SAM-like domain-containing protein [Halomonas sabkhae]|nr:phage integrase N-terminal SAM-like domain-containing protein [Halomonas sabkhae]MDN3526150.1 phage integrase N-terminal SAM-like domain-containing protein [Halomonas sabkhae]
MQVRRYSPRTVKTYCYWIRFFIRFHGVRHPVGMGTTEIHAFLEHLAIQRKVAAATRNQALNALAFLYHYKLGSEFGSVRSLLGWVTRGFRHATAIYLHVGKAPCFLCGSPLRHGVVIYPALFGAFDFKTNHPGF